MLEQILERENLKTAWKQVRANQGSPGVDGITIEEFPKYIREHWQDIKRQILDGSYRPKRITWSDASLEEFKYNIRQLTARSSGISMKKRLYRLSRYIRGWMGYYACLSTTRRCPILIIGFAVVCACAI